jgi:Rod binding domain-containing protein
MEIQPIGHLDSGLGMEAQVAMGGLKSVDGKVSTAEAARQFEAIMLRQLLDESLGKVFSKGAGLGLARVIESQLTERRSMGPRVDPRSGVQLSAVEVEAALGAFKRSKVTVEGESRAGGMDVAEE